jgi:hypothetical protein
MNTEKIVKLAIKTIAKATDMDYEELKGASKKVLKMAKNYDSEMLSRIEEIIELQDVTSEEEVLEFDVDTLKLFCKIKDIDHSDTEKSVRVNVWKYLEEQFEMDSDEESDDESEGSEDFDEDSAEEIEPEPEPVRPKSAKKKVQVIESPAPVQEV